MQGSWITLTLMGGLQVAACSSKWPDGHGCRRLENTLWKPASICSHHTNWHKRRHLGQFKGLRKLVQKHVEELKAQILLLPKLLEIKGMDGKGVAQSKGEGWYLQDKVVSIILLFNIYEVIQFSPIFEFKFFPPSYFQIQSW